MKKFFKFCLFSFLLFTLIGSSFILYLIVSTKDINFNPENLVKNTQNIQYYDTLDKELSVTNGKSEYCTDIPSFVKNAFISVEDKRFYNHNGIDLKRIFGASIINLKNLSFSQGASTISQQLIKNTHLTNKKTLKRKFAEIKLTLELESKYSKEEILNMYLNNIYFGENCYGIKNASEKYFGKAPNQLNVAEGAMLAGIIKAPSKYNPIANYDLAMARKNLVLDLMREKHLTEEQYLTAKNYQVIIKNQDNKTENAYLYQVNEELKEILKTPYINGKLKVYTYLNSTLQKEISDINTDVNTDRKFIVINNKSMGVEAYYSTCQNLKRSPGSTIKPILVYAPNYQEKNVNLYTKILDEPTDFNGYTPKNYNDNYYGYVSCLESLSKSLNIPSVKLLNTLGEEKTKKYAKKLGISINDEGLSLALGSLKEGISLKDLASCYSTFSNNGNFENAKYIKEIKNEKGQIIYKRKNSKTPVFSPETSYLINYSLMDCAKNGTARKINNFNYEICAKTGTNGIKEGNFDAYTLSYTTNHTVGVWLGNRDNSLMDNKISGATYPCLISGKIYSYLYKEKTPNNFEIPNDIVKVNLDKRTYEDNYYLKLANEGCECFEGVFIKGTEPKEFSDLSSTNIPNIKDLKMYCNITDISLFYDLQNSDGIYIYEIKNKPILIGKTKENKYNFYSSIGKHVFLIKPFKEIDGKTIFGKEIVLPEVNLQKEVPKEWWRE